MADNEYGFDISTHNGCITMVNPATGDHRTIRVHTQKDDANFAPGQRIISLLTGPNRWEGFGFVVVQDGVAQIRLYRKKRTRVFRAYADMVLRSEHYATTRNIQYKFEGSCRRCNATLTNPVSIDSGIGPTCARIEGEARAAAEPEAPEQMVLFDIELPIHLFTYGDRQFTAEISSLGLEAVPREFAIMGEQRAQKFTYSHRDMDASGEDVAGWRYVGGDFRVLLIND